MVTKPGDAPDYSWLLGLDDGYLAPEYLTPEHLEAVHVDDSEEGTLHDVDQFRTAAQDAGTPISPTDGPEKGSRSSEARGHPGAKSPSPSGSVPDDDRQPLTARVADGALKRERLRHALRNARLLAIANQYRTGSSLEEKHISHLVILQLEMYLIVYCADSFPESSPSWDEARRNFEITSRLTRIHRLERSARKEHSSVVGGLNRLIGHRRVSTDDVLQEMVNMADPCLAAEVIDSRHLRQFLAERLGPIRDE